MAESTHYQGVQKASTGFKLLKSMGWSEGEGLGANKQGLKEHIRVKKKFEMWGVGAVESHNRTSNWSNGMNEFHRVLSSLSEITSKHANGSSSEDDDGADGDQEVEEADRVKKGEQRPIAEEKKQKKDKKEKRKKDKEKDKKRKRKDESNVKGAGVEEKGEKKKATHIGRFKRRETSKMVKGYSSSDLAAILGEDPFAKQAAILPTVENTVERAESSSDDDADVPDVAPVESTENSKKVKSKSKSVQLDAWWAGYFVLGPRAGSRGEKVAIKKRQKKVGFSEADQEALDAWAHSHATQGKVGLGRSSMRKTIGGAKWEGTKTKLGSDSDEDDELPGLVDGGDLEDEEEEDVHGIQVVLPKKNSAVPPADDTVQRVRELLGKEKKKELKVKALAKAMKLSKDALVDTLKSKPGFKLSKSKSRVSLAE